MNTKAKRYFRLFLYIVAICFSFLLVFLSSRIPQSDPIKEILQKVAIAICFAIVGMLITSLVDRLFDSHVAETNKAAKIVEVWQELGFMNVSTNWFDFRTNVGIGKEFHDHLKRLSHDSVWYIITINPEGLSGDFFKEIILPALEQGVKIKWSYVKLPEKNDITGETLRIWWDSQYSPWTPDIEKKLKSAKTDLTNNISEIIRNVEQRIEHGTIQSNVVEIYESRLPTTFLALLAVNKRAIPSSPRSQDKFIDTHQHGVALIYPYIMFSLMSTPLWGMVLSNTGHLYKQYANSIIRFFNEGQKQGYLKCVYPNS